MGRYLSDDKCVTISDTILDIIDDYLYFTIDNIDFLYFILEVIWENENCKYGSEEKFTYLHFQHHIMLMYKKIHGYVPN